MIFYFRENIIHTTPDNKRDIRLHPSWLCAIRYIGTPRNNDYVIIPILLSILLYHYTYYIMLKRRSTSLPTSFPADPLTSVIRNNYYYYNERECYILYLLYSYINRWSRGNPRRSVKSPYWHYANFGIVSLPAPQTHASGTYGGVRYHGGQLKKNQPCYRCVLIFKI